MAVAETRLSLEEFLRLSEEKPALEYFDGKVSQKAWPNLHHSALQGEVTARVNAAARPGKVALAFLELCTTFAGASLVPDVSIYRWARIQRDPEGQFIDDMTMPPDIAIEIISPGQSTNALVRRCRWYVANGVELALLIDPADQSVLAFRPDGTTAEWTGEDRIDLSAVVPEFDLTVREFFGALTGRP